MTEISYDWTSRAPAHWRQGRLKDLIDSAVNGVWGDDAREDGTDVYCVRSADFDRQCQRVNIKNLPRRQVDARAKARHLLRKGDLILEKSGGGETQPVGAVVLFDLDVPAVCSNFSSRLRPARDVDARYLAYVMAAAYSMGLSEGAIKQTTGIQNLDTGAFFAEKFAIPRIDEQRRIADFLDSATALASRMMMLLNRQISIIEERRLARALEAIRGTHQEGLRRASGINWIGDIPENWPMLSVISQFDVQLGKMLNQDRVVGSYLKPYLRNTNVQWDRLNLTDLLLMNFPPRERRRYQVVSGDLLICEGGQPGRAAVWDECATEIYYQKALHRARSRGRSHPRWLLYCLMAASALDVFVAEGNTTTIAHLTGEQLRSYKFPFPEPDVQVKVVANLDVAAEEDKRLANAINRQKSLSAERLQALITAAVTGQIDVATARGVGG